MPGNSINRIMKPPSAISIFYLALAFKDLSVLEESFTVWDLPLATALIASTTFLESSLLSKIRPISLPTGTEEPEKDLTVICLGIVAIYSNIVNIQLNIIKWIRN